MFTDFITPRRWNSKTSASKVSTGRPVLSEHCVKDCGLGNNLEFVWGEWRQALRCLRVVEDDGWTNPTYTKALFDERRAYKKLLTVQLEMRSKSLPL